MNFFTRARRPSGPRRACLTLNPLEARDVPAGAVTAVFAGGVLTLTGDAAANNVVLTQTGATIQLSGADTTFAGGASFTGVSAVRAALGRGNDAFAISATADFKLSGALSVNLGNGDNDFTLATAGKIDLGGVAVTGGTGSDTVIVSGGAGLGSRVGGVAAFNYNGGESATTFADIAFGGAGGVAVSATGAGNASSLSATAVTVANTLTAAFGTSFGRVTLDGGSFGDLTVSGLTATTQLDGVTVAGDVSVTAVNGPQFTATDTAIDGKLTLAGSAATGAVTGNWSGDNSVGEIVARGRTVSVFTGLDPADSLTVAGDVVLRATATAALRVSDGTFAADNVSVTGATAATVDADGAAVTLGGDLLVASQRLSSLSQTAGTVGVRNMKLTAFVGTAHMSVTDLATGFAATGKLQVAGAAGATADVTVGTLDARDFTVRAYSGPAALTLGKGAGALTARNVTVASALSDATLTAGGASVALTGNTVVRGGRTADVNVSAGSFAGRGLTVTSAGRASAEAAGTATGVTLTGDALVAGAAKSTLTLRAGPFAGQNLTVSSAGGLATVNARNQSVTLAGGLTVASPFAAAVTLNTTALSEVGGDVRVTGGGGQDEVTASSKFRADRDVVLNLMGGDDTVSLGDTAGPTAMRPLAVGGSLSVLTGDGDDTVTLLGVTVAGASNFLTGNGADLLSIDAAAAFTGEVTANLGAGNDFLDIAQNTGSTAGVTFTAMATFLLGAGNDRLRLGLAVAVDGDANSKVTVGTVGSVIDGGAGADMFSAANGQFSGVTPVGF